MDFGRPSVRMKPPNVPSIVMNSTGFKMIDLKECQIIVSLLISVELVESVDSVGSSWNNTKILMTTISITKITKRIYLLRVLANIGPFKQNISNWVQNG